MSKIKMYGTPTCKDCVIAKQVFQELGTDYEFINIVNDEKATQKAIELNNGVRRIPVILFADNSILVEPNGEELKAKMAAQ
ncbi:MAG TPA: glutaredoxin family protein [Candidatus Poseidoniia archaeon]|jgi:glutaredoxin|nr:glutaredoxin family protein [Candidatus Poseidoniia archaeon]|tara:strand:- start:3557 stop:3799 length:243 start_codon:yes stop_codon:yes gene_type:complete